MLGTAFFDSVRVSLFGGSLSQSQVDALKAIDAAWQKHGTGQIDAQAYTFATIFNEVGASMLPKAENLNYSAARAHEVWPSKFPTIAAATPYQHDPVKLGNFVYANILGNGGAASGDGYRYRGHGYQTTGRAHFTTFAQVLAVDLVAHPELLDQSVELAAAALIIGMVKGLYTGKSFETYLDGKDEADSIDLQEFINARRIVNGTFNAVPIAQNAIRFEHALRAATTITAPVAPAPHPVPTPPAPVAPQPNLLEKINMNISLFSLLLNLLPVIPMLEQDFELEVKNLASSDDGKTKAIQTLHLLEDASKKLRAALGDAAP